MAWGATSGFDPVAMDCAPFQETYSGEYSFEWSSSLFFSTYTVGRVNGRRICDPDPPLTTIFPGHTRSMHTNGSHVAWSDQVHYAQATMFEKYPAIIQNNTESLQNVALRIEDPRDSFYFTSIAYHPIGIGQRIVVPESLTLQVYIVNDTVQPGAILTPEDLKRPLFSMPIPSDIFRDPLVWWLTQDLDGEYHLVSRDRPELGRHSVETLARSHQEMKLQLAEALKHLNETQNRLDLMETFISGTQDDVHAGQRAIAEMQRKASREPSDQVEAKLQKLAKSFELGQGRIFEVEKSVADLQQTLSILEEAVSASHNRPPDLADLQASTDARLSKLEESVGNIQEDLSSVEQLAVTTHWELPQMTQSAPNFPGAKNPSTDGAQPGGLGGCAPAVMKTIDELSLSLDEARKDVFAIQNHLRTMDRRVPTVEQRAETLERLLGHTREDLAGLQYSLVMAGDRVTRLDSRVAAMENLSRTTPPEDFPILFPAGKRPEVHAESHPSWQGGSLPGQGYLDRVETRE